MDSIASPMTLRVPWRSTGWTSLAGGPFTWTLHNEAEPLLVIVEGIDLVVQDETDTQWFASFCVNATDNAFYYDSQSIGEGNGVYFPWRGSLTLYPGDELIAQATGGSEAGGSCQAYGTFALAQTDFHWNPGA